MKGYVQGLNEVTDYIIQRGLKLVVEFIGTSDSIRIRRFGPGPFDCREEDIYLITDCESRIPLFMLECFNHKAIGQVNKKV